VQCKSVNVDLFNKAGYTASMLAALIDTSSANQPDKRDLTSLMQLFRRADLNLKSKKEFQTALMLAASHGRRDTVRQGCKSPQPPHPWGGVVLNSDQISLGWGGVVFHEA